MALPTLPADKANHVLYGVAIFAAAAAVGSRLGLPAALSGVAAAALFGAGKELADWLANRRAIAAGQAPVHGVEFGDALATVGGAVLGWLVALAASLPS